MNEYQRIWICDKCLGNCILLMPNEVAPSHCPISITLNPPKWKRSVKPDPGVVEASIEETLAKVKEGTAEAMAIRKSVSYIGGRR